MSAAKEFFDTSVFIAAFWKGHPQHEPSLRLVSRANPEKSTCAAYTLAEVYSTMTALPVKNVIPPDQALLFVGEVRSRCRVTTLDEEEYWDTLSSAASVGFTSGRIYDALLLRCARKAKAKTIYTWNYKHFLAIAPDLADRIKTP